MKKNKTVIVGLSGGVDSSVAAALLQEKGFSVVSVFMRFWFEDGKNRCCSIEGEERARKVAGKLNIPFYVINLEKEFKEKVVDSFFLSLKEGKTPNPCVVCNREIKFGFLMENLATYGADFIATGHYVRIKKQEGKLLKGKDKNKDQSYFLWNLKKEWIKKIIFPLGDYQKEETRALAEKFSLPTAKIAESQEVCFIPDSIESFLKRNLSDFPGKIVDVSGKELAKHNGLFYYTIGQRKKMGLPGGPYYVLKKNKKENHLVVTKEESDLFKKELFFEKSNFFRKMTFPETLDAKIRYRGSAVKALVEENKLVFFSPQRAITSGQSVVFYKGDELIGGGIIK